MSLQLAAVSYINIHYVLKKKRKERRWWQRQLYTSREVYSGSSLLADLNFQSVSGLYKNFTRMSSSEFEFFINLIWRKKSRKRTQRSGKSFLFKKVWHWRCLWINSVTLPSVHSISQFKKRSRNHTTLQIRTTLQDRSISNEKKGRGADGGDVSRPHLLRLQPYHPFDATAKYRQHTEQVRNVTA
jgi:hypothetical protein